VTDATSSAVVEKLPAQLPAAATASPIVLNDDSIVVPGGTQLNRLGADGQLLWSRDLGGAIAGVAEVRPVTYNPPTIPPLVPDRTGTQLLVTTADGKLHALKLDGSDAWAAPGQVSPAAVTFPGFAMFQGKQHLYLGGADGRLRCIIIDGPLEDRAAWPKPLRDQLNLNSR
jgi:hypothetical protein